MWRGCSLHVYLKCFLETLMANADVTTSMGDMLMVKGNEGDTITGHKAQVILHLQSIDQG